MTRDELRFGLLGRSIALCVLLIGIASAQLAYAADQNCDDFATHDEAQSWFEANGGSATRNIHFLDGDGDGVACERLIDRSPLDRVADAPTGALVAGGAIAGAALLGTSAFLWRRPKRHPATATAPPSHTRYLPPIEPVAATGLLVVTIATSSPGTYVTPSALVIDGELRQPESTANTTDGVGQALTYTLPIGKHHIALPSTPGMATSVFIATDDVTRVTLDSSIQDAPYHPEDANQAPSG